jgi:H+-transporting ATPase
MQTWILTMITRKIFIPPFLALGVVLFGTFVLNPTLMVLLMFATDVATMSVSTDRVSPSSEPDRWVLRSLITRSVSLSAFLMLLSGAI